MRTIEIDVVLFSELMRKAIAFDMYQNHLQEYGGYISDIERMLFDIPKEPKGEPEPPADEDDDF